jgi:hypothetical protein
MDVSFKFRPLLTSVWHSVHFENVHEVKAEGAFLVVVKTYNDMEYFPADRIVGSVTVYDKDAA